MLLGQQKLKQITDFILKISKATETEVLVFVDDSALTRFANNQIHQNVASQNLGVQVRCLIGKKQGVASTNLSLPSVPLRGVKRRSNLNQKRLPRSLRSLAMTTLDLETRRKLQDLAEQAYEIAKVSLQDPIFSHLPGKTEGKFSYQKVDAYKESTALVSPQKRANEVETIIKMAQSSQIKAFGSLSTGVSEVVVANSHGVFAYHPYTQSILNIRMMSDNSSGYAGEINLDFNKLEIETAAKRAINKTLLGQKTTEIKPGPYEVILEEPAVAEMMTYMAYLGFGARAYHEERSFMSGNLGKKIMNEKVTIWDDALDSSLIPMPFDYQGLPKQKVTLIEKGIAKNILYDHYLGTKYKIQPTGHGFPAPGSEDAYAANLHLAPGKTPRKDLLKGIKKGILVSRFWYVRNVHPKELSITGMTRDGTFLIENGEIVSGVPNMRFTVAIPRVLSSVTGISQELRAEPSDEWTGASLLPSIRVGEFAFTGVSKL